MPHINRNRRTSAAAATLAFLLAALLLTACGGSSKGSSSTAAAARTTTNGAGAAKGAGANGARFTALRECLQKNGVTLAKRTPGQRGAPGAGRPGGGGFRGGAGPQLPKGVTQAQFQAALKKCGGANFGRGGKGFGGTRQPQRLAQFSACMSKNGVKLPAPNTSGKGPIFNTKGVNTASAAFKAAYAKCMKELRPAGDGGPAGAGGAPGAAPGVPEAPAG